MRPAAASSRHSRLGRTVPNEEPLPAAQATRCRARLGAKGVRVVADVHVKHGAHAITADRSLAELTRDVEFLDADAAIATGQRSGDLALMEELRAIDANMGAGLRHSKLASGRETG